jgi:hypothetical protein
VPRHRALIPLFVLLAALAISACGSGESDEDKVTAAIEAGAMSNDPADCEALLTVNFLEQVEGSEGQEAIEECEEDAEDEEGNPDSVDITEVEVDGSSANANVAFNGGGFDGQTLNIALVEEDGKWKLDEIQEFVTFDRGKIDASFEEALEGAEGVDTECILEGLGEYSDAELEEAILEGEVEGLIEVSVEECQ